MEVPLTHAGKVANRVCRWEVWEITLTVDLLGLRCLLDTHVEVSSGQLDTG